MICPEPVMKTKRLTLQHTIEHHRPDNWQTHAIQGGNSHPYITIEPGFFDEQN